MVNSFGQFAGDVRVSDHISQGCAKAWMVVYVCMCLIWGVGLCLVALFFLGGGACLPLISLLLLFHSLIQMDLERSSDEKIH